MAAEALEAAAAKAGVPIAVETQGSAGAKPLPPETIAAASAVIFAVDVGVRDRGRFAGKPVVSSSVKRPIEDGDAMIAEALRYADDPNAPRVEGALTAGEGTGGGAGESWGARTRRVLMTGVSYMIPFVAAGGLLIALGFLFGGYEIVGPYGEIAVNNTIFDLPNAARAQARPRARRHRLRSLGLLRLHRALFFIIGKTAFALFIPAFAGYVAYAIADRPGIAPGFIMGGLAANLFNVTAADGTALPATGFLGAIVGGVLAGVDRPLDRQLAGAGLGPRADARDGDPAAHLDHRRLHHDRGPRQADLLAHDRAQPRAQQHERQQRDPARHDPRPDDGLRHGRAAEQGRLCLRHRRHRCGKPGRRRAPAEDHGLGDARRHGAPIALALATVLRPNLFTVAERENGKAGWLLGASFITEGAIPFAAADPLRVIPSIMLGSAVTGALSEAFNVGVRAPHGGIFVIFAVHNIPGYLISLAAGVLIGAIAVVIAKTVWPVNTDVATV